LNLDWLTTLLETYGEGRLLFGTALTIGLVFGAAAQRSQFCMRAATVEVAERRFGPRLLTWLFVFAVAVFVTQAAVLFDLVDLSPARQLSAVGSMSGAVIGGLLFGIGMILARGCASRLLVLAATGNLRAIVTGLVLTLTAQAALSGVLAPAREGLAGLWLVDGGASRNVLSLLNLPRTLILGIAIAAMIALIIYGHTKLRVSLWKIAAAGLVGIAVAVGWIATGLIAMASFEIVPVTSITFTGPSSDTLMALVTTRSLPLTFASGLVPGVAVGAALAALLAREFKIQRFDADTPMESYLIGAVLMGFGSMLAGGCAVGAVVSGGAVMAVTGFVAGASMWAGAMGMTLLTAHLGRGRGSPGTAAI